MQCLAVRAGLLWWPQPTAGWKDKMIVVDSKTEKSYFPHNKVKHQIVVLSLHSKMMQYPLERGRRNK